MASDQELQALREKLQKQESIEQLKSQFLSIVSHELRTPMTPIQAQVEMLTKGLLGELNSNQQKSLNMIGKNISYLNNLLGEILDISKLESGTMNFSIQQDDIVKIVQQSVELLRLKADTKNVTIIEDIDKIPLFSFDAHRILQVINNLINNAIKFTPEGGKITVSCKNKGDHVQVAVSDTGIGIPTEEIDKIFRPFHQVDATQTRKYEGSGLGLAISKGIILYHLGRISVESELGKGSTFKFELIYAADPKSGPSRIELFGFEKIKDWFEYHER